MFQRVKKHLPTQEGFYNFHANALLKGIVTSFAYNMFFKEPQVYNNLEELLDGVNFIQRLHPYFTVRAFDSLQNAVLAGIATHTFDLLCDKINETIDNRKWHNAIKMLLKTTVFGINSFAYNIALSEDLTVGTFLTSCAMNGARIMMRDNNRLNNLEIINTSKKYLGAAAALLVSATLLEVALERYIAGHTLSAILPNPQLYNNSVLNLLSTLSALPMAPIYLLSRQDELFYKTIFGPINEELGNRLLIQEVALRMLPKKLGLDEKYVESKAAKALRVGASAFLFALGHTQYFDKPAAFYSVLTYGIVCGAIMEINDGTWMSRLACLSSTTLMHIGNNTLTNIEIFTAKSAYAVALLVEQGEIQFPVKL